MDPTRRSALKTAAAVALGAAAHTAASAGSASPKAAKTSRPRVVIVGGGWSGLSIAKYTRIFAPTSEVILIEQRDVFISCPVSNLWLVDKVETDFLMHDYLKAARNHDYTYLHATVYDVDKQRQVVHTTQGEVPYDYLVLATGIEYDYSRWTNDPEVERVLRTRYPAAFRPGSEHWTLKEKIRRFKGGTFLMTVPSGNYRCLPAPYERAALVADYFKHNGIKGRVLLLDENNDITIKEHGFHTAYKALYRDYLQWEPNAAIERIDLEAKQVHTEFDTFRFDDASFYPHVRGARLLETIGLAKDSYYNRLEGDMDAITYAAKGYANIFIAGDARKMGFSKSGNTALSEGQHVARLIAARIEGRSIPWASPVTLCISAVSAYPERGIFIHSEYAYDAKTDTFSFATPVTEEIWQGEEGLRNGRNVYRWARSCYADLFG
jgi:NADH dehydrogenase FAD-containing subunit